MEIVDSRSIVSNPLGNRSMIDYLYLILHHSVTTISPSASIAMEQQHIRNIDKDHKDRGFGGFGYHGAIFPSGRYHRTGDIKGSRAHVRRRNPKGIRWNQLALGLVIIDNLSNHVATPLQVESMTLAIVDMMEEINDLSVDIDNIQIGPHNSRFGPILNQSTGCPKMLQYAEIRDNALAILKEGERKDLTELERNSIRILHFLIDEFLKGNKLSDAQMVFVLAGVNILKG